MISAQKVARCLYWGAFVFTRFLGASDSELCNMFISKQKLVQKLQKLLGAWCKFQFEVQIQQKLVQGWSSLFTFQKGSKVSKTTSKELRFISENLFNFFSLENSLF